jgi:hypothetical protein
VAALQPPTVIVKDNADPVAKPVVLRPGDAPEIRAVDVESFFLYTLRLRYGWQSPTVLRDGEELYHMMTQEMASAYDAFLEQMVPNKNAGPGGDREVPRVKSWIQAMVRNEVSLDRAKVDCREGEQEQWYCRGFGAIETYPLVGKLPEGSAVRQKVEFRGRFQKAPYSSHRLWGLGVAYVDAVNVEE